MEMRYFWLLDGAIHNLFDFQFTPDTKILQISVPMLGMHAHLLTIFTARSYAKCAVRVC